MTCQQADFLDKSYIVIHKRKEHRSKLKLMLIKRHPLENKQRSQRENIFKIYI